MDGHHDSPESELEFLSRLSVVELETLLRFGGDPADVEMLFDAIAEEVVARERENDSGRLPDVNTAWAELQARYALEREQSVVALAEDMTLSDSNLGINRVVEQEAKRKRQVVSQRIIRTTATILTTVLLSMALMVGVQAAGADVFGALARWTDDTFHFEIWSVEPTYCEALHDTIQEVLDTQGILGEFAPTWYPDGCEVASVKTSEDALGLSIDITLLNEAESAFFIRLDRYNQNNYIDPLTFEIESGSVEDYSSKGRTYYIFANAEMTTAAFSDSTTLYRIWGEVDIHEMKCMIDSIGG